MATGATSPSPPTPPGLSPLPYHLAICDYLKAHEPAVWQWFRAHRTGEQQAEQVRFDLLKNTYRLERSDKPRIYDLADEAARRLGLEISLTIYQSQGADGVNASLAPLITEAHLILHGPIADLLSDTELVAVFAHELSHLLFWRHEDGELQTAYQVLAAMTNDPLATPTHTTSARWFVLYEELFCDRGALLAVGDPLEVVRMLLKVHTKLSDVSAESYLRQADEIFAAANPHTDGVTHPEAILRARAVKLWADQAPEAETKIAQMIEGPPALDELDLLTQERAISWTRALIDRLLAPAWFQTESVLAHARQFFPDWQPNSEPSLVGNAPAGLPSDAPTLQDYFSYCLLDFVTADRDLDPLPLAAALDLADDWGFRPRFVELVRQELKLRKGQLDEVESTRKRLLSDARTRPTGTAETRERRPR